KRFDTLPDFAHIVVEGIAIVYGAAIMKMRDHTAGGAALAGDVYDGRLLKFVVEDGGDGDFGGMSGVKEYLDSGVGDKAQGSSAGVFDRGCAGECSLNADRSGAGLARCGKYIEHVVQIVRGCVMDRAVQHPVAVIELNASRPAVALEVCVGTRPVYA